MNGIQSQNSGREKTIVRAVYLKVVSDVQKAFPDYALQVAMDTDFAEE